jgi:hypothetical protein
LFGRIKFALAHQHLLYRLARSQEFAIRELQNEGRSILRALLERSDPDTVRAAIAKDDASFNALWSAFRSVDLDAMDQSHPLFPVSGTFEDILQQLPDEDEVFLRSVIAEHADSLELERPEDSIPLAPSPVSYRYPASLSSAPALPSAKPATVKRSKAAPSAPRPPVPQDRDSDIEVGPPVRVGPPKSKKKVPLVTHDSEDEEDVALSLKTGAKGSAGPPALPKTTDNPPVAASPNPVPADEIEDSEDDLLPPPPSQPVRAPSKPPASSAKAASSSKQS